MAESERALYTVKVDAWRSKDDVKIAIEAAASVEPRPPRTTRKKGDRVVYRERSTTSFARAFTLPAEVDQAESSAKMEHGVLTLTFGQAQRAEDHAADRQLITR